MFEILEHLYDSDMFFMHSHITFISYILWNYCKIYIVLYMSSEDLDLPV